MHVFLKNIYIFYYFYSAFNLHCYKNFLFQINAVILNFLFYMSWNKREKDKLSFLTMLDLKRNEKNRFTLLQLFNDSLHFVPKTVLWQTFGWSLLVVITFSFVWSHITMMCSCSRYCCPIRIYLGLNWTFACENVKWRNEVPNM